VFLAAADCTGHGVPGAMLTMVCCALLSKAVVEYGIKEPGKILDKVRDMVLRAFNGSEVDMNDGMDISLCAINKKTLLIEWSGANNPLLYFRNGEMFEINGDKQPVGRYERYLPFTTHTRQLHEGDTLYMFSDGYMDQFGGTKGKKFMYKNLKQVFTELKPVNMQAQKEILDNTFQEWKRDLEQVDDVLVIGVKL
jgi:serine phosphatase RsbU (regulator of sigma subunit)